MKVLRKLTDKIPLWIYNVLTIASSAIAIVTFIVGIIIWFINRANAPGINYWILSLTALCAVVGVLSLRIFKYRKLLRERMKMTSEGVHNLTHSFRNMHFDIFHDENMDRLTVPLLTKHVEGCIQTGLDSLCNVMAAFTGEEVSACIKLIECTEDSEEIDLESAKVRVFCRSKNSDSRRVSYDHSQERANMYLKDDTALMRIVGPLTPQDHFYCGDLDKFEKACEEAQEEYKCPTKHRSRYYNGTMVLPIRIPFEKLHYYKKDVAYHIIGFLCADSPSKNAFQPNQEDYNCKMGNAFADEFYVILSEYRRYLTKLKKEPASGMPGQRVVGANQS